MKFFRRISLVFLVFTVLFALFFYNVGTILSAADIAKKADVVICLSGSGTNDRIEKAVLLLQKGLVEKVAVTTDTVYQEMLRKKVNPGKILRANWSAKTTYGEGSLIKAILDKEVEAAMVVTDPFHLYRVKWTFLHIFSDDSIAFSFISSDAPSLQGFWWSNKNSRLFVLSELPKIAYYWFWHGLLGIAEDPQWAIDLERAYLAFVRDVFMRGDS
jgi:uncharacterized SAM-binding protein YcdF (DUF218 family)